MELSQRKPNRLSDFDYNQNGAYFVTICTHDRKRILSDIVGDGSPIPKPCGMVAEEMITQITIKYPSAAVDTYVIMPDHIHLLLVFDQKTETGKPENGTGKPSPTLGNIIGWYKYQVTKLVNKKRNIQGEKLFQRSYYDHVIRNRHGRSILADGGCIQPVGIGYDTLPCPVRDGKCESKRTADRQAPSEQGGHSLCFLSAPPLFQGRPFEHFRIGKDLRSQQNHRLQVSFPLGKLKTEGKCPLFFMPISWV